LQQYLELFCATKHRNLNERLQKFSKVTSVYYWKPDGLDIQGSGIPYLGRSLFDRNGNASKGISAWKTQN
jgi:arabinogalactan endo-1,4-beta-galactosidase